MVDPLCVIETCVRYFCSLAQTGRKANAPLDEVRKCFEKAAHLAALAAPYRHPRLSAVKLNKHPIDPALRVKASLEELRVQMLKHWEQLAPVLDLEALVAPSDGIGARGMTWHNFQSVLLTLIGTGCVATNRGTV